MGAYEEYLNGMILIVVENNLYNSTLKASECCINKSKRPPSLSQKPFKD